MKRAPAKALSLFDSTCIIVGIIIGAGIYETTPTVAACMGGWGGVMGVWLVGGLLALCGALCYAELATAYPHQGGDYVYLNRAYGPWAGFLFGWSQLAIIRPGDIALMAFVFARYAATLYAPFPGIGTFYAAGAVVALTAINMLGVRESKWTQDVLTVIKIAGLLFIVVAGLLAPGVREVPRLGGFSGDGLRLAMILVLFTYGGWNEMAYVAAEIKNPQKNILRSLVLGTVAVAVLYLLINGAFLHALGFEGMAASEAVAVDAVATVMPESATKWIGIIICISALGAVNGLVFTGARISYAMGTGHRVFQTLGKWHPRFGTPVAALVVQGALSLGIVLLAGSFIDTILYSAPAVWLFFLATGLALFRLRKKDAATPRPYKVWAYPFIPTLFCAACAFMLFSSATYAFSENPVGLLVLWSVMLSGMVLCGLSARRRG
ncbi:MAG: amino acid permease [Verrucomicrobia bacterium]|nr:amino acid permease [Verrucomicrobiota bacterium]